jgi:hypothetical protein
MGFKTIFYYLKDQAVVFISLRNRVAQLYPRHWVNVTLAEVEVEVQLQPMVRRPVCLGVGLPSGTYDQIFLFCLAIVGFLMLSTFSDQRMGL